MPYFEETKHWIHYASLLSITKFGVALVCIPEIAKPQFKISITHLLSEIISAISEH